MWERFDTHCVFPHHLHHSHTDTIRTVEGYADAIVLRHFAAGSARAAAAAASIPLINAGDGPGQHPTQALLDVYTIRRELGRLDGVRVALMGDLANGRTARSLAYLLSSFPDVSFVFVAPDVVRMGADIKDFLSEKGIKWEEVSCVWGREGEKKQKHTRSRPRNQRTLSFIRPGRRP